VGPLSHNSVALMTPLDLRKAPPRSPREKVRGLCMLPRMIDIARAKLAGGEVGEYQIGRDGSLSAAVLSVFNISAPDFIELVRCARTDDEVAEHLWPAANVRPEALSARLWRATVADVPAHLQSDFHRLYGADLARDRRVFDIIDEDDARMFNRSA
jgi:Domain of unknown function (DUF5069)